MFIRFIPLLYVGSVLDLRVSGARKVEFTCYGESSIV